MARILPGLVWPTAQDIDQLLARSRGGPAKQDNRQSGRHGSRCAHPDAVATEIERILALFCWVQSACSLVVVASTNDPGADTVIR
jgi:hypothetical protein